MKVLVVHGEGLGNIIEVLPLIRTLQHAGVEADLFLTNTNYDFPLDVFKTFKTLKTLTEQEAEQYDGKLVTIWGHLAGGGPSNLKGLNRVARQEMSYGFSEVKTYLRAAKDLGITEEHYDCAGMFDVVPESSGVVLVNGYNAKRGDFWLPKTYPYFDMVAAELLDRGYNVTCMGEQKIEGTVDRTGLPLRQALGVLAGADLVVSTDTGFYHAAAALNIPGVVIFTFTSVVKNCDSDFHRSMTVLRNDVSCYAGCHSGRSWLGCEHYSCRELSPNAVLEEIYAKRI